MPGIVLLVAFQLYCVLDVILADEASVRNLPRMMWLVFVVLVPLVGGIAWLIAGRPERAGVAPGSFRGGRQPGTNPSTRGAPVRRTEPRLDRGRSSRRPPRSAAPRGPDDDPEFLRRIEEQLRRQGDADD